MRLIARRDTSLAAALIGGALITFERPFRWAIDAVREVELRYQLDLLPALTLLVIVFVFHQYKKRVEARAELTVLARDKAQTDERRAELERLMELSQQLAGALDRPALEQVLWRGLPAFIGQRECSIVTTASGGGEFLLRDAQMLQQHTAEALDGLLQQAVREPLDDAIREGRESGEHLCLPLVARQEVLGGIIIRNQPPLGPRERLALGVASGSIAVAMRNLYVLADAREIGARDSLTGCYTRAHAMNVLLHSLRLSRRHERPTSVIMLDVDDFKGINDTLGHLGGDGVLASIGQHLNRVLRSTDVRCRYGGDEFIVILPDTPCLGAQQVAECLRREIAGEVHGQASVTISLGVASALPGETDVHALVGRADHALYRAKRAGRNRYCVTSADDLIAPAEVVTAMLVSQPRSEAPDRDVNISIAAAAASHLPPSHAQSAWPGPGVPSALPAAALQPAHAS